MVGGQTHPSVSTHVRRFLRNPAGAIWRRLFSPAPQQDWELGLIRQFGEHAKASGLHDLVLFLSFDCDLDLDIAASTELHRFLSGLGIKMTMAVPGVQLQNGASTYRALADAGVEFMNHGYLPHTIWQGEQFVSQTFYHEMTEDDVAADIRKAHRTVLEVIGNPPAGFRAPHFGTFQQPQHLQLVYELARELSYSYCSTTSPSLGHERGPVVDMGGVVELPTFGSARAPITILDSWTYLTDRRDYALGKEYAELMIETVDVMLTENIPGILSWYADPCHVVGQEPFERAMQHIAQKGLSSMSGTEAAGLASKTPST